jgi:hypothetical protein
MKSPQLDVVREDGQLEPVHRRRDAVSGEIPRSLDERDSGSHHRDELVELLHPLLDLGGAGARAGQVRTVGMTLLSCRGDARTRARHHEFGVGAAGRCFEDDPAALAVPEQADRHPGGVVHCFEARDRVGRLLDDPRVLPAPGRWADATLVEGGDRDPRGEEVLADRREEDVVVAIRRARAGMHQHRNRRRLDRHPERAREGAGSVRDQELANSGVSRHAGIVRMRVRGGIPIGADGMSCASTIAWDG